MRLSQLFKFCFQMVAIAATVPVLCRPLSWHDRYLSSTTLEHAKRNMATNAPDVAMQPDQTALFQFYNRFLGIYVYWCCCVHIWCFQEHLQHHHSDVMWHAHTNMHFAHIVGSVRYPHSGVRSVCYTFLLSTCWRPRSCRQVYLFLINITTTTHTISNWVGVSLAVFAKERKIHQVKGITLTVNVLSYAHT